MNKKSIILILTIVCLFFSFKDDCGTYRWFVKTLTDKEGELILKLKPGKSSIAYLTGEIRNVPNHEKDNKLRYADEKRIVTIEATILKIKMEDDNDFHVILASGSKTMVGEVPDGDCSSFDNHSNLRILSIFTGFKIDFLPFKLCPFIFLISGLLIFQGFFIKEK